MTDSDTLRELEEIGRELGGEPEPPPPPPLPLSGLAPPERTGPGPTQRLMARITIYILAACLFVAVASFLRPERTIAASKRDRAPAPVQLDVVGASEADALAANTPTPEQTGPVAPERNADGWP